MRGFHPAGELSRRSWRTASWYGPWRLSPATGHDRASGTTSSPAGLTRGSIILGEKFCEEDGGRVKPGHDGASRLLVNGPLERMGPAHGPAHKLMLVPARQIWPHGPLRRLKG